MNTPQLSDLTVWGWLLVLATIGLMVALSLLSGRWAHGALPQRPGGNLHLLLAIPVLLLGGIFFAVGEVVLRAVGIYIIRLAKDMSLPALHPALQPYRNKLEAIARPAWLVRCEHVDSVSAFCSHMGGSTPFAPRTDGWPKCGACERPLQFICQFNFSEFKGIRTFARRRC